MREKNILKNYLLYFLIGIVICIVGITGVFADEVIDTSTWINVTGRNWSLTGQEYYSGTQVYNSNWLLNHYNITGGIYTPPSDFDYITFSFFQHSGSVYNPCNDGKYTAEFELLMETTSMTQYVNSVKWAGKACNISKDTSNGHIGVSCIFEPTNSNLTTIRADLDSISGTYQSNFYISRNIDITCGVNTEAIINNATENTQNIINNQNNNTQNIIDNQNANTDKEIESQKVCSNYDKSSIETDNIFLNSSGNTVSNNYFGISDYISINKNSELKVLQKSTNGLASLCFYNTNKTLISCIVNNNMNNDTNLTIPNNADYFRFSIDKGLNLPQLQVCTNGNQALADQNKESEKTRKGILGKLGDLISRLFSNDDADISGLDNMAGWLPPGPLDSIINLPLNLFNALVSTLSGTCSSVSLTLPFVQQQLILPCFDSFMSQYLTGFSTLWTFIGVTVSVFILYHYLLALYKWVDDTLTLRENNLPGYYDDNWGGGA